MNNNKATSLELVGIRKTFGDFHAVDDISLQVQPGELVTFLGASGSGKSTTLMLVAGFQLPDLGHILLNGKDMAAEPPHLRDIGIVFQHYALFPHLSVAKNIAFPLELRRVSKAEIERRVREVLDLVRLRGFENRRPAALSGGQQQRVALARALVFEPLILLLDEPLGALDKNLREEMQFEIRSIQQRLNITTLSVTHDQEEAMVMSDRIAIMQEGRIEQIGTAREIYEHPSSCYVAEFMGLSNIVSEELLRHLSGGSGGSSFPADRYLVRPERIMLGERQDSGLNARAVIKSSAYVGNQWRFGMQLATGDEIQATATNIGTELYSVGDEVFVGCTPESAWRLNR